jgi:hypothetical protein
MSIKTNQFLVVGAQCHSSQESSETMMEDILGHTLQLLEELLSVIGQ